MSCLVAVYGVHVLTALVAPRGLQVAALEAEKAEALREIDVLREELSRVRSEAQLASQVHESEMRQRSADVKRQQSRAAELETRHADAIATARRRHEEIVETLNADIEELRAQCEAQKRALADRTVRIATYLGGCHLCDRAHRASTTSLTAPTPTPRPRDNYVPPLHTLAVLCSRVACSGLFALLSTVARPTPRPC